MHFVALRLLTECSAIREREASISSSRRFYVSTHKIFSHVSVPNRELDQDIPCLKQKTRWYLSPVDVEKAVVLHNDGLAFSLVKWE